MRIYFESSNQWWRYHNKKIDTELKVIGININGNFEAFLSRNKGKQITNSKKIDIEIILRKLVIVKQKIDFCLLFT